jgi:hypothetical protein
MRRTILILLLVALAPAARAQQATTAAPPHTYQLGTKRVVIPPPAGFVEAMSQSDLVARVMAGTEDPRNEVLASHLPAELMDALRKGQQPEMHFYTKVSVVRMLKAHEMSEAEFAAIVAEFEKSSQQVLDINGPTMKSAVRNLREGLSNVKGAEVPLEVTQPQNLGSYEKSKDVYSVMLLMTVKGPTGELPILAGGSFVRVRSRLLFIFTYRKFTSEKDAEVLRDFSRQWVAQIVAANR